MNMNVKTTEGSLSLSANIDNITHTFDEQQNHYGFGKQTFE